MKKLSTNRFLLIFVVTYILSDTEYHYAIIHFTKINLLKFFQNATLVEEMDLIFI